MTISTPSAIAIAVAAVLLWAGGAAAETRRTAKLMPPVSAACISSPFGPRILPNQPSAGTYHYGVDLPAPEGAPVVAAASGTVIRIQNGGVGGLEVLVQHDGFVGVYSHLASVTPAFTTGTMVGAGEKLGVVGHTGLTFGRHLYFEMILAGKPVDPAPYLGVPACKGAVLRTQTVVPDADGKLPPTRQYYQIYPDGQYYQWPHH